MYMIFQTSLGERRPEKIALLFFLAFFGFAWFFMGLCPKPRKPFEKGLSENFMFCSLAAFCKTYSIKDLPSISAG